MSYHRAPRVAKRDVRPDALSSWMLAQPAAEHDRRFLESLPPGSRGDKCGRELMDSPIDKIHLL